MVLARSLRDHFNRLYESFLKTYVTSATLIPTKAEEDAVKAFCVLAHAALEEYFEDLSSTILKEAVAIYESKKIVSKIPRDLAELQELNDSLCQLIETLILGSNFSSFSTNSATFKNHKSKLELATQIHKDGATLTAHNLVELTKTSSSYTVDLLREMLKFFKGHLESNQGAALFYMLRLLVPVGIDIPNNLLLNSIQKLAKYRGSYAHTNGMSNIVSAPDMVNYARDIIRLCFLIELGIKRIS